MFGMEEAPEVELKKLFWKELQDSPFMMLGLQGVEDSRTRPMTAQIDVPDDGDKEDDADKEEETEVVLEEEEVAGKK